MEYVCVWFFKVVRFWLRFFWSLVFLVANRASGFFVSSISGSILNLGKNII